MLFVPTVRLPPTAAAITDVDLVADWNHVTLLLFDDFDRPDIVWGPVPCTHASALV